jgi:hypothetical protein
MALQLQLTTAQGFTASTAYARITSFSGNKYTIQVNVEVHKDYQARTDNLQTIATYSISLPTADGASMQQMYNALKLDSNFAGAIDV